MSCCWPREITEVIQRAPEPGGDRLQVLRGHVQLATAGDGLLGDLLVVPRERHGLHVVDDSVSLLTVLADSYS